MAKEKLTPISVHDKEVAALGATEEEQDMSTLARVVVPMGSYTDPNKPEATEGSVNMNIEAHPVEHAPDYGQDVQPGEHLVVSTMDGEPTHDTSGAKGAVPEDRAEWSKQQYKDHLASLGLPVSGNMDELKARVDEYDATEAEYKAYNAGDWQADIEAATTIEDLDELQAAYERSGADFTTVEQAFTDQRTEITESK